MCLGRKLKTISNGANSSCHQKKTVKTRSQFRTLLVDDGNSRTVMKAKPNPFTDLKVNLTVQFIILVLHINLSLKETFANFSEKCITVMPLPIDSHHSCCTWLISQQSRRITSINYPKGHGT